MSITRRSFIKGFGAMLLMPAVAVELVFAPLPPVTSPAYMTASEVMRMRAVHSAYVRELMEKIAESSVKIFNTPDVKWFALENES